MEIKMKKSEKKGDDLDGAIGAVLDPAAQPVLSSFTLCRGAKVDSLHPAPHYEVDSLLPHQPYRTPITCR